MRFTSKVFRPCRSKHEVTVFGSARTRPEEPVYRIAQFLGQKLVEAGYMGIKEAEQASCRQSMKAQGLNILCRQHQAALQPETQPGCRGQPRLIVYKYFFNRKVAFLKEADAIVLFPGGFGTLDEAMETLTLLQTGKHDPLPLVSWMSRVGPIG